jgi:FdhD protein
VEGRSVAVVMRTPGHDEELAAGFLVSEGVVQSPRDILEVSNAPAPATSMATSSMCCSAVPW